MQYWLNSRKISVSCIKKCVNMSTAEVDNIIMKALTWYNSHVLKSYHLYTLLIKNTVLSFAIVCWIFNRFIQLHWEVCLTILILNRKLLPSLSLCGGAIFDRAWLLFVQRYCFLSKSILFTRKKLKYIVSYINMFWCLINNKWFVAKIALKIPFAHRFVIKLDLHPFLFYTCLPVTRVIQGLNGQDRSETGRLPDFALHLYLRMFSSLCAH